MSFRNRLEVKVPNMPAPDETLPLAVHHGRPHRVPELDALRGIGAFLIIGYHFWPSTFYYGWTRADLFFVLSGYLITSIILRNDMDTKFVVNFMKRRALRIWPAYYLLLSVLMLGSVAVGRLPGLSGIAYYCTFTQNIPYYWSGTVPRFLDDALQTWTLAIEQQFYILWPIIILVAGRRMVIPIACGMVVVSVLSRYLGLNPIVILSRCDGLALGSALAALLCGDGAMKRGPAWLSPALLLVGIFASCLIASGLLSRFETPVGGVPGCGPLTILAVNLVTTSVIGLLVEHSGHPWLSPLRWRVPRYFGQISYGIFLYHLCVHSLVCSELGYNNIISDIITIQLTIIIAMLSWEYFESPIVRRCGGGGRRGDHARVLALVER
jgi:peptidoglycan/LPS O-acetylase OafA/YrhL